MKIARFLSVLIVSLIVFVACGGNGNGNAVVSDMPFDEAYAAQYESPSLPTAEDEPVPNENGYDDTAQYAPKPDVPAPALLTAAMFPFEFEAEDLYGNIVTHESLGERELFLLYLWTTWCGACIASMPGMAELAAVTAMAVRLFRMCLLMRFKLRNMKAQVCRQRKMIPSRMKMEPMIRRYMSQNLMCRLRLF